MIICTQSHCVLVLIPSSDTEYMYVHREPLFPTVQLTLLSSSNITTIPQGSTVRIQNCVATKFLFSLYELI